MVEENKDLNKGQPVTDPDLNAQPVTEPGVSEPAVVQPDAAVLADGTPQDKDVPYTKFKEANEAKNAAEEAQRIAEQQAQQAQDRLALMQANQVQSQAQKTTTTYEQALQNCGLIGEQFLTQEQQIQVNAQQEQLTAFKTQQQQQVIADQQFAQSHPDFVKAVGSLNPVTGQFMATAELQKILMGKPYLQASCLTAQGAYEIVMQERKLVELSKKTEVLEQHQIRQNADANLAPMSPASVGGGAVSRTKGEITQNSTTKDVLALEQRVKAGEFG